MIVCPFKKMIGLIGAPRSGKNTVADFLQQTRGFVPMAFADKIKEEYGISKEKFEAAKMTGNIDNLRTELWNFSAKMKESNPNHFIDKVMQDAINIRESVVIADIRTVEEFDAFFSYGNQNILRKVYWIRKGIPWEFEEELLRDSKLSRDLINNGVKNEKISTINNSVRSVYYFYRVLDNIFFRDDTYDIFLYTKHLDDSRKKEVISDYFSQFEFKEITKDVL